MSDIFSVDLRSLAVMRIAVGAILLHDLIQRSGDIVAHYTDFGLLPRTVLIATTESRWYLSFHLMNGTWQMQALLFALAGLFALLLIAGYHTRLVTVLNWLFFLSLSNRNPIVLAGDALLCAILFWSIFMPWGARFSLDRALHPIWDDLPDRFINIGTLAHVAQMLMIFWFGALWKYDPEWRVDGTAIYYALSVDQLATPLGTALLEFPRFLKLLTFGVYWFEFIGPLLLFSPVWSGPVRTAIIGMMLLMFLGFAACLVIGILIWTMMAGVIGLLPSWFWDQLESRRERRAEIELTAYYESTNQFALVFSRIVRGMLRHGAVVFQPVTSDSSITNELQQAGSWLLVDENGSRHCGRDAAVAIASRCYLSSILLPLVRTKLFQKVGARSLRFIASHRWARIIVATSIETARVPALRLGKLQSILVAILVVYVATWNLAGLVKSIRMSERVRSIAELLGLEQKWTMFAPSPGKDDGWYVIPGKLKNGREVDLFQNGNAVTWAKPAVVSSTYRNFRWQKYMTNFGIKYFHKYHKSYAAYLCRNWNAGHGGESQLVELTVYFMLERTLPNGDYSTPEKFSMLTYRCSAPE